ncbi:MAG: protein kinase [Myxococcales bacterium]|nr:protein kinase [Myxococcales bacterium]
MLRAGDTLLGRYELVAPLAEGAGGETWRAEGPNGPVVVKVVRGEDRRRIVDLLREATVLRTLRHPNIVAYRELSDRTDEDTTVLVTEFVEGGDLEDWVFGVGPRPVHEVAGCGLQVVEALAALADVGVLHRDLKPSNVLVTLTENGPWLRVADFGISRPLHSGVARTTDRSLTPAYAAPEQHRGDPLTPAADLYALGGILGFLATGRHPQEVGAEHPHEGFVSLQSALLALEPSRRPTLAQTRAALQALAAKQPLPTLLPPEATPTSPSIEAPLVARLVTPRRSWAVVGAVVASSMVAMMLWAWTPPAVQQEAHSTVSSVSATEPSEPATEGRGRTAEVVKPVPPEPSAPATEPNAVAPAQSRPSTESKTPSGEPVVLRITSRPWSWVDIDGQREGRTSDAGTSFVVPMGSHHIRLESDQGHVWEQDLVLEGDRRLCVQLRTGTEIGC